MLLKKFLGALTDFWHDDQPQNAAAIHTYAWCKGGTHTVRRISTNRVTTPKFPRGRGVGKKKTSVPTYAVIFFGDTPSP